ncbi:unnamed protein product [Rhizophagus irregularis]|nr:unnamed protein product [Rhizophagus irregularis]
MLDCAMNIWVENILIKEKAKVFAESFGIQEDQLSFSNGLYYRIPPNQTLSSKPVLGQKKNKTQITILLDTNAIETDKLKPWGRASRAPNGSGRVR